MKQLLRFSILLLALILPATATAYDFEVDGIYYNINGNEATVTYNSSLIAYSGFVVIPATVTYNGTTYQVTAIGDEAFCSCDGLTSVVIPNSVTSIGFRAFANCVGLTSVTIPNSVAAFGDEAFWGCLRLTGIVIPNSITSISKEAFSGCSGLTSIVIPNSVTAIGDKAFFYCKGLTSIVIPNSVTAIGDKAFWGCVGLTDVYCYIADLSRVSSGDEQFYSYDWGYSRRTLHVLQGTADAYHADKNWYPYFGRIVEDIFLVDVNGDREVNIADVNVAIDMILGGSGNTSAADVNRDGEINIADINAVIDIILSGTGN